MKSLGVGAIYLNPIFEASSNHKYDTADYMKIDPGFGDDDSFKALVKAAGEHGISLILDGVFSHTGADSIYFNRFGNYDSLGACQGEQSAFFDWYHFKRFPDHYDSWWGVDDLPTVNKWNSSYQAFIFGKKSSVIRHYLAMGARGWRLDVADELPDEFIQNIKSAMAETAPDTVLLGEVWEDASNKISYGQRRRFLLGRELHSVTNYPFRLAALDYMLGKNSAFTFADRLMSLKENYPEDNAAMALNLIGSHDRIRVITLLGDAPEDLTESEKEYYKLPPDKYALAKQRLKILVLIQFAAAGVPCVYYGDEAGMQGFDDPYNRAPFPWGAEDAELTAHYRALGMLRHQYKPFISGSFSAQGLTEHVFVIRRWTADEEILVIINRGVFERETIVLPTEAGYILDLLTSEELKPSGGQLSLSFEPLSAKVLYFQNRPPASPELGRCAGVLCHIISIPGASCGEVQLKDVYRFVDFLADSGQKLWQLLPLNPVGKGNSPFYSPSVFALGAYIIDEENAINDAEFHAFCRQNTYWLDDYALYMSLKDAFGGKPWQDWPDNERNRHDVKHLMTLHAEAVLKYKHIQYQQQCCWHAVKKYAESRQIRIIGDLPIYAAPDSAEVWAHRDLFMLDENGRTSLHAGVPPDYFSREGQDWGNPLYHWDQAKEEVYLFWENRLRRAMQNYDTVRLDHFRSFSAFFAIPDGSSPIDGYWISAPGIDFFTEMRSRLDSLHLIAEDLGVLDTGVCNLLKLSGLPGMNVWQFSADEMESMPEEESAHRIFYSGTHDNQTLVGWCSDNFSNEDPVLKADEIIKKLYDSAAPWVIIPLQDILLLGDDARMNTPGTIEGNWKWHAERSLFTDELSAKYLKLAIDSRRF